MQRLGMPPHVIAHVTASRFDLEAVGLRVVERGTNDLRGDAAMTHSGRHFGVVDTHHAVDERVRRDAQPAFDRRLESTLRGVVPDLDDGARQGSWILPPPGMPPGGRAPPCGMTIDDEACRRSSASSRIACATPSFAASAYLATASASVVAGTSKLIGSGPMLVISCASPV